jgi:hypothetical protein
MSGGAMSFGPPESGFGDAQLINWVIVTNPMMILGTLGKCTVKDRSKLNNE